MKNSPSAIGAVFGDGVELGYGATVEGAEIHRLARIDGHPALLHDCVVRGRILVDVLSEFAADASKVTISDCTAESIETATGDGEPDVSIGNCAFSGPLRLSGGGTVSGTTAEVYALGSGIYRLDVNDPKQIVVLHDLTRLDAGTTLHPDTIVLGGSHEMYGEMFKKQGVRHTPSTSRSRGFAARLVSMSHFRRYLLLDRGEPLYLDARNQTAVDAYLELRGTKRVGPVDVNALAVALALHPNM